ncbi:MAG: cellulase N-terminal Ig-like domain-containing protein, partial [Planctomycetota bacterium]
MEVLVNHVGYETAGPKRFVCRSEENLGPSGHFEVIDRAGRKLREATAARMGATGGAGPVYYAGDFSGLRSAGGDFQVRFEAGNLLATSRRFGVGSSILWRLTKPLVVDFLRTSRATRANHSGAGEWQPPGILHEDGLFHDVAGGWFDRAGEGGVSLDQGARAILALALALARDPRDPQTRSELRWGADWLARLMSRYPDSGSMVARAEPDGTLRRLGPDACREPSMCLVAGALYAGLSEALGEIDLLRRGERFW